MTVFSDSTRKEELNLLDYVLHPEMRNLVSVLYINYKPIAKSDLTLFEIPPRYSLFSIIKILYNI